MAKIWKLLSKRFTPFGRLDGFQTLKHKPNWQKIEEKL